MPFVFTDVLHSFHFGWKKKTEIRIPSLFSSYGKGAISFY